MSVFKDRLALLMQHQGLSRQQVAEVMDLSLVSVHKWLSGGNIKESVAQQLSAKLMCDWLWLKHGITRIPQEMVPNVDTIMNDTMIVTVRPDEWYVEQMGQDLRAMFDRHEDNHIIDLEAGHLSLPEFWQAWGDWAEYGLTELDRSGSPVFDCSGVLVDRHEQVIDADFVARIATCWTDPSGETHLVLIRQHAEEAGFLI